MHTVSLFFGYCDGHFSRSIRNRVATLTCDCGSHHPMRMCPCVLLSQGAGMVVIASIMASLPMDNIAGKPPSFSLAHAITVLPRPSNLRPSDLQTCPRAKRPVSVGCSDFIPNKKTPGSRWSIQPSNQHPHELESSRQASGLDAVLPRPNDARAP